MWAAGKVHQAFVLAAKLKELAPTWDVPVPGGVTAAQHGTVSLGLEGPVSPARTSHAATPARRPPAAATRLAQEGAAHSQLGGHTRARPAWAPPERPTDSPARSYKRFRIQKKHFLWLPSTCRPAKEERSAARAPRGPPRCA